MPVEVGADAAHRVVQRGGHGQQIRRRIEAVARQHGVDARKLMGEALEVTRVEERAATRIRLLDDTCHHIAGSELAARIGIEREPAAVLFHEMRAGAAHGLGDERRRVHAGELERRGMELQELEVAQLGPHLVRERPAVAGGAERIRRDGVQLADTAGGEHHRTRRDAEWPACRIERDDPDSAPVLDDEPAHFGVLQDGDLGQVVCNGGQAAHQLGTGPVAIGVQDARARVRRLEAEPEPAVVAAVELGAELQQLANAFRALGHQHPNGLGIREPVARFERVLRMQGRRVTGTDGHGNAALRPRRGAVGELALREQHGAAALAGQAPCGPQSRYAGANDDRRGV